MGRKTGLKRQENFLIMQCMDFSNLMNNSLICVLYRGGKAQCSDDITSRLRPPLQIQWQGVIACCCVQGNILHPIILLWVASTSHGNIRRLLQWGDMMFFIHIKMDLQVDPANSNLSSARGNCNGHREIKAIPPTSVATWGTSNIQYPHSKLPALTRGL